MDPRAWVIYVSPHGVSGSSLRAFTVAIAILAHQSADPGLGIAATTCSLISCPWPAIVLADHPSILSFRRRHDRSNRLLLPAACSLQRVSAHGHPLTLMVLEPGLSLPGYQIFAA